MRLGVYAHLHSCVELQFQEKVAELCLVGYVKHEPQAAVASFNLI